jgi:PAS domain S-box-containing protein
MSGFIIPTLYAMSGACAFAALSHGHVALRQRLNRRHLLFALLSLLVMALALVKAGAYQAETAQELVALLRWEHSVVFVFLSLFSWFVAEYTGIRPRKLLAGLTIFWALILAVNLLLPYGIQFVELPRLSHFELPWGESVVDLRADQPGIWLNVTWMGIFTVMAYSLYACLGLYRHGPQKRARALSWTLGMFFGFLLFDAVVDWRLVEFTHTSEFGFISLMVLMDLEMMLESRDQKQRMRTVLDHLPAAICLKDLNGRYQLINRGFETLFHVADAEILGKTDFDLFSLEKAEILRANQLLAIERREEVESEEVLEWNGKRHIYESHQFPMLRPDGYPYAVVGVYLDITESRQKDEALHKFRQQVWHTARVSSTGAIAGSLAHELCQPLSAILNNAQAGLRFLAHDVVDLVEIHDILQDIVRDDKRAGAVINGLRAMLQQQETPYANIDLAQCIEEVIELLHSEFVRLGVEVEHMQESNLTVWANKTQIQQVVLNLMINAMEAMAEQPAGERILRVKAERADDKARVSIRDNGIGIPEEKLNRVFDGFYTTKPQGLGVGLEVCRSIIESHRGVIWVEANPDRGVTFHFTLPFATVAGKAEGSTGT